MGKCRKKFKLEPGQLEIIARSIGGDRCSLSAMMMPNDDEFIRKAMNRRAFNVSSVVAEIDEMLRERMLDEDTVYLLEMLPLCHRLGIHPFWSLKFEHSYSPRSRPEIVYSAPFLQREDDEPYKSALHPAVFALGLKWYSVSFNDFRGGNVLRAQQAIDAFSKQGYALVRISAKLNPHSVRGDHCEYEESDASLYADREKADFFGVPEDFEIPKSVKELPASPNVLDGLVRGLLEKKDEE